MFEIDRIIRTALQEDIGHGDVTTLATVEAGTMASPTGRQRRLYPGRHRCRSPGFFDSGWRRRL